MKVLVFVDPHTNKQVYALLRERAKHADIILCGGDISIFGRGYEDALEEMNSWGKPVYFIHGNHEDEELFSDVTEYYPNLQFIHKKEVAVGDLLLWGYGGGGFAHQDPELEQHAKQFKPYRKRIMLFHGPPANTTTDIVPGYGHVGCRSRRKVIEKLQPVVCVVGHIHDTFDTTDKIGNTLLMNPGPLGKLINIGEKQDPTPKKKPQAKKK